jgi:hypothetical protein
MFASVRSKAFGEIGSNHAAVRSARAPVAVTQRGANGGKSRGKMPAVLGMDVRRIPLDAGLAFPVPVTILDFTAEPKS